MQYMHVKCGANYVNSLGLGNLFYNDTRRTLRRLLMQERCNGVQSREAPIDVLDPASRLNTYTGRLKERVCCWEQFLSPLLAVFPCGGVALCKHNTSNRWSLRKLGLESYMQGKIYMKLEVK